MPSTQQFAFIRRTQGHLGACTCGWTDTYYLPSQRAAAKSQWARHAARNRGRRPR
jgi:hypothetical protein